MMFGREGLSYLCTWIAITITVSTCCAGTSMHLCFGLWRQSLLCLLLVTTCCMDAAGHCTACPSPAAASWRTRLVSETGCLKETHAVREKKRMEPHLLYFAPKARSNRVVLVVVVSLIVMLLASSAGDCLYSTNVLLGCSRTRKGSVLHTGQKTDKPQQMLCKPASVSLPAGEAELATRRMATSVHSWVGRATDRACTRVQIVR